MITVKSPFRISLFGGSTDYKNFYEQHGSFLIVEIGKKDKEPQLNIEVNGTAMVLIIITFGPTTNNIHQKPKHGPLH